MADRKKDDKAAYKLALLEYLGGNEYYHLDELCEKIGVTPATALSMIKKLGFHHQWKSRLMAKKMPYALIESAIKNLEYTGLKSMSEQLGVSLCGLWQRLKKEPALMQEFKKNKKKKTTA